VLKLAKDVWPGAVLAVGVLVVVALAPLWRTATENHRAVEEARADPHRIAGDLYFVGTPTDTSFLLVGPVGHVLIGGGADSLKVLDNIERLGFVLKDVKVLLASGPHPEEAGELADLQNATGAELWASNDNAGVLARGGKDDPSTVYTPHKLLAWAGVGMDYHAPRVDHRFKDGETIRLGPLAVTAHITPGHAPGCTTWTFTVRDRDPSTPLGAGRDLHVVHRCSLTVPFGLDRSNLDRYPGFRADFERTFRTLRSLPVDIWLTSRGIEYGRYRKYQASLTAADPAAPFIDREGYLQSIDDAEQKVRALLAEERR
jgi:metallo-beta-lactamase class B